MKLTPPQFEILVGISEPTSVRDLTNKIKRNARKNPAFSKARVDWSNHRATYNYIYRVLIELKELGLVECDKSHSTHIWELVPGIEIEVPPLPTTQEELPFNTTRDPRALLLEAQQLIQEAMSQLSVIDKLREIFK